jgi:MFS family permease
VRILEGAGFLLIVVSAPSLVATLAAPADRSFAMGIWGCFMPGGIALGLATAPIVEVAGWRVAWLVSAALMLAALLCCWKLVPPMPHVAAAGPRTPLRDLLRDVVAAGRPLRVAAAFASYSVLYFGVAAFLPAYLESLGTGTGLAGGAAALAALANLTGNLAGAALMRRGIAPERLVVFGAVVMGGLAASVFVTPISMAAAVLALLASVVGGLVPAACFALLPASVPRAELVSPAVGMTIQANNLMQLLAPPLMGALAGIAWGLVALPLLLAGLLVATMGRMLAADGLRRVLPST